MALRSYYSGQACSMARALEIIGERWTLLVVRDAFYGVRRFNDFAAHLTMPRSVLTERLRSLIDAGVLEQVPGQTKRAEYLLTAKGLTLWPIVLSMMSWGDEFYASGGPRRVFVHEADQAPVHPDGVCSKCAVRVSPADIVVVPGPGLEPVTKDCDVVTATLAGPHRLLTSI